MGVQQDSAGRNSGKKILAVMMNNERYVSVNELCSLVAAESGYNAAVKKFEVKLPTTLFTLTEGSPFVVVNDFSAKHQSVEQMSASAIFINGTLYAPAKPIITLFNRYSPNIVTLDTAVAPPRFDIIGLSSEKMKNGYLIRIHTTRKLNTPDRFLRNDVWLYVTISNATADTTALNRMMPFGIVRELIAVQSPTSVQLTFFLRRKIAGADIIQDASSNDILVALRPLETDSSQPETALVPGNETMPSMHTSSTDTETTQPATEGIAAPQPVTQQPENLSEANLAEEKKTPITKNPEHQKLLSQLEKQRRRWKLDVVVLDPGHGGYDPGTIGTIGTREKDITLGIALK
ncbi:MAG: N-acetylmuramoyl-L-alanine amidase, partial [Bacteroidota bacterium]|nr:N-acetylmuramoyl-L-alanine amidase [Bacteroidota bacterium]